MYWGGYGGLESAGEGEELVVEGAGDALVAEVIWVKAVGLGVGKV